MKHFHNDANTSPRLLANIGRRGQESNPGQLDEKCGIQLILFNVIKRAYSMRDTNLAAEPRNYLGWGSGASDARP